MSEAVQTAGARLSPGLRYRDVGAAIVWLSTAFGFERRSVVADGNGHVSYAELSFGNTIIMLAAVKGFEIDRYMAQPDDIGGAETQCCYYAVDDIDAHYVRARNAGCEIVIDLKTASNGERNYTCRDPEGHLWSFGTYDPWQRHLATEGARSAADNYYSVAAASAERTAHTLPRRLAAGVSLAALVAVSTAAWMYGESWRASREASAAPAVAVGPEAMMGSEFADATSQLIVKEARRRLLAERTARRAAERASLAAREEAAHERSLRVSAEQTMKSLAEQLASAQRDKSFVQSATTAEFERALSSERTAKEAAERTAAAAEKTAQAAREDAEAAERTAAAAEKTAQAAQKETQTAERAAKEARAAEQTAKDALAAEQTAKEAAVKAADATRSQLAEAQAATVAAEKAAEEARARLAFVSQGKDGSSIASIDELRKQMQAEQAAREAAEREIAEARSSLARERSQRQAAWRTVEQLKKRLAMVGANPQIVQQVPAPKKAVRRAKPAAQPNTVAAQPAEPATSSTKTASEWSVYSGPAFFKQ
jgi:uncharacterized glyoxalase superfamily protein PhnB